MEADRGAENLKLSSLINLRFCGCTPNHPSRQTEWLTTLAQTRNAQNIVCPPGRCIKETIDFSISGTAPALSRCVPHMKTQCSTWDHRSTCSSLLCDVASQQSRPVQWLATDIALRVVRPVASQPRNSSGWFDAEIVLTTIVASSRDFENSSTCDNPRPRL